jgi:hypothetical protein
VLSFRYQTPMGFMALMNGSFSFPEREKSTLNRPIDYRTEYFVFYNGERPCMFGD